jgi:O-methyltransferase
MAAFKQWIRQLGFTRSNLRALLFQRLAKDWLMTPYLNDSQRKMLVRMGDPIRYGTFYLSIEQIQKNHISGSLAECGVYKGSLSKFVHGMLPDRRLYLFDTFQGFDQSDSDTRGDNRFKDTSEEEVLRTIVNPDNVIIRKGLFPSTAAGLEAEKFAFVVVDFDKYEPTRAALDFFYPRMEQGGFVFVHDYSNSESNWACSRALDEFLADKSERPILIPDAWGTAVFRKI